MTTTRTQRTGTPSPRPAAPPAECLAEEVLARAQSGRVLVQDFVPLAESLEWNLGQEYLRDRGVRAFISDFSPVPWVVNNDGSLSHKAAGVFYASLADAEAAGQLVPGERVFVLELGIGVGLFARFFLDALRALCRQQGKDYYDRLTYVAADRSERMLHDLLRNGVLSGHGGHFCVRQVDALEPGRLLPHDALFGGAQGPPLRAVFLNYLLDCLPAAVLQLAGDQVNELHVRTVLGRGVDLADYTELTAEQLRERAKFTDRASYRELLPVYGLMASEYDYRPAELKSLPYGDFALNLARGRTQYFLHSYGAIQSLHRLMELVHPRGFILMNDYGSTGLAMDHPFEHQRFSLATFVGVNFAELRECFGRPGGPFTWAEPEGAEHSIHSRLLMHAPAPGQGRRLPEPTAYECDGTPTGAAAGGPDPDGRHDCRIAGRFLEVFGPAEQHRLQQPVAEARQYLQYGRFEMAADAYRKAIARQPYNWVLLSEAANFLIHQYRGDRPNGHSDWYGGIKAGIDLAKLALAQNPTCSAELWNVLGDGLYEWGRYAEAGSAYRKALAINDKDVRATFNLSFVHLREKDYGAALLAIARALDLDKLGQYRDRLLQKQQEALHLMTLRNQQEYFRLFNLVSRFPALLSAERPAAEGQAAEPAPETAAS